jgi:EpsD family peptidyl-prolyl cis-trans isomerase
MLSSAKINYLESIKRGLCMALLLGTALALSACGNKEKKAGQTLVRVNGVDITVLQVNDELKRAGVKPEQQEVATKQLLESLIDRQLVLAEAMRNEIDRTTDVVQAIERAKAQIIAQAYLKSIDSKITKPSASEINDYYQKHPEYFAQRKQFDVQQLVIATKDFSNDLRQVVDTTKSLEGIAAWLDKHDVRYVRGQLSRSTTDLPEYIVVKLKEMQKGQIFIVNEGEGSMINLITNIRIAPVSEKTAAPQIEQYLFNKKTKEVAEAEITHLRASAKIEYLNASAPAAP